MVLEVGLEHKIATTCLEAKKMGEGKKRPPKPFFFRLFALN